MLGERVTEETSDSSLNRESVSEWRSKWREERKFVWFIWPGGHCANSTFDHRFKGDSSKAGNHSLTVESLPR